MLQHGGCLRVFGFTTSCIKSDSRFDGSSKITRKLLLNRVFRAAGDLVGKVIRKACLRKLRCC